jgi:hypothetical protein
MSWVSVSLVEVHLRVVSFVIFASWRFSGASSPRHHRDPAPAHWPAGFSRHSDRRSVQRSVAHDIALVRSEVQSFFRSSGNYFREQANLMWSRTMLEAIWRPVAARPDFRGRRTHAVRTSSGHP